MKKLLSVLTAVSFSCFLNAAELTVPQADTPDIDGKVSADEYKNAVVINNFFLSASNNFPQEKTKIFMLHDGKFLYAAAIMNSYALDPRSNMTKEFKAVLHGDNKPVWDDDSLELRALSDKGERFYCGFNANAANFIRIPKRFAKPEIRCTAADGYFCAELKLPLDLLDGKWNINFVRFEKRLKETTLAIPNKAYNLWSAKDFFRLHRGSKHTPGIKLCNLQNADTDNLQLYFSRDFSGEYTVKTNGKSTTVKIKSPANKPLKITAGQVKKGTNLISLQIKNAQDKWQFHDFTLNTPDSQFAINCNMPQVKFIFNGQELKNNAVMPMTKSFNKLEIISPEKQISFSLRHGAYPYANFPGNFAGAAKTVIDGNKVTLFAPENSRPPYKFSKIFTVTPQLIRAYGMENNKLLLSCNDVYDFEINPVEIGIFPLENITFSILIPEEIKLLDVCSRIRYPQGYAPYKWPSEHNMYSIVSRENKTIDGKKFELVNIKRDSKLDKVPNMTKHYHSMRERCHLIFRSSKENFKGEMQFFVNGSTPSVAEIPRIIPVEVTAPLQGIQPEKLTISLYAQMQGNLPHDIEKMLFDTWKKAGVNEVFLETTRKIDDFDMFFFLELTDYGYYRSVPDFRPLFKKYPQLQANTRTGKKRGDVSLTALADMHKEIEPELTALFSTIKSRYPSLKKLFWDFEHPPFTGLYADFSARALAKFKQDYNIKETNLTPALIEKKYKSQWVDFRARELGRAVPIIRRAANANGFKLVMYCDYAAPKCPEMYGLDWQYIRNSADEIYCGYGRNEDLINKTKKLVAPSKTVFGLLTNRGSSTYQRALILRRILDSRGGVLCWYEKGTGAAELKEIAAVTEVVAKCEELIINGKDVTPRNLVTNAMDSQIVTRKLGNKNITFILNEENINLRTKIKFPAKVRDLSSGKIYPGGKNLNLRIPPMYFAAFEWND